MGKKFEGLLLAADFDGTFADCNRMIPEKNIRAVEYFISEGGLFSICSGRSLPSIQKLLHLFSFNAPFVLCNGAFVYDFNSGKAVWSRAMDKRAKQLVTDIIENFPDVGVEAFTTEGAFVVNRSEWTDKHIKREKLSPQFSGVEELPRGILKFFMPADHERLLEVEAYAKNNKPCDFDIVFTEPEYLEILDFKTNKALGLSKLIRHLGISSEKVIAAGNYFNDISMLQFAGLSACPVNSPPEVLSQCKMHLASDTEGAIHDLIDRLDKLDSTEQKIFF